VPLGVGVGAGLATGVSWSLCAQAFAAGGRRIGSIAVNHVRLVIAAVLLPLVHLAVLGMLVPHGLAMRDALLLVASGVVGLGLGDAAAFSALARIGAARTTVVITLTPAMAALLARGFLGEQLASRAVLGMGITLAGLLLAVAGRYAHERDRAHDRPEPRVLAMGLFLALLGCIGQAGGQVLARPALANVDPLSATLVRIWSGASMVWLVTLVVMIARRRRPRWWTGALSDRRALWYTFAGTLTGPVFGVWLSQIATKHAPVGVAATLMALVPAWVLIAEAVLGIRRPGWREIAGVAVALAGVVVLLRALGG
jgi:drug/metabolite transporter (DMT)-like permease